MGRYDDQFDISEAYNQYNKTTNNNTMVIHQRESSMNQNNSALDMPRKYNEYQHSRKRNEDCRQSNLSSNRGEKGQANDSRNEYDAHQIGRKELM